MTNYEYDYQLLAEYFASNAVNTTAIYDDLTLYMEVGCTVDYTDLEPDCFEDYLSSYEIHTVEVYNSDREYDAEAVSKFDERAFAKALCSQFRTYDKALLR